MGWAKKPAEAESDATTTITSGGDGGGDGGGGGGWGTGSSWMTAGLSRRLSLTARSRARRSTLEWRSARRAKRAMA
jgi:hypothetical protein